MSMRSFCGNDLALLEGLFAAHNETPFFVKDAGLRYVAANPAMARLCGLRNPGDLHGKRAGDLFPAQLASRYEALDRHILATGRTIVNNMDLSIGGGQRPIWLVFTRLPVRDDDGQVIGIAASARQLVRPDRRHPVYLRLADAARAIRSHASRPLDLTALARTARISRSQLERDFKHVFGLSPQQLQQNARIEHAVALLELGGNVADIAYACGYADHSAFSRSFKRGVGISPSEWRRRLAEQR